MATRRAPWSGADFQELAAGVGIRDQHGGARLGELDQVLGPDARREILAAHGEEIRAPDQPRRSRRQLDDVAPGAQPAQQPLESERDERRATNGRGPAVG